MSIKKLLILFFLISGPFQLRAQENTLNRQHEPVVIRGDALADFLDVPVEQIFVFSYDSATDAWEMIPFQIDERDTSGSFVTPDVVAGFDGDDELIFLIKDAGDQAERSWAPNNESQAFPRQEIQVTDPADDSKKAWAYVYRSSTLTLPANPKDYVDYAAGPGGSPAADTVKGETYTSANGVNGLPNFLSIPAEGGGTGVDIVNKQELQISALFIGTVVVFNETNNLFTQDIQIKDGNIRLIRELIIDVVFIGQSVFSGLSIPISYYPFSYAIAGEFNIPEVLDFGVVIRSILQSLNLNEAAVGMNFFSKNNSNILIDGMTDAVDLSVTTFPDEVTWTVITGTQGAAVSLFTIPGLGESQSLVYVDDADTNSYGNVGFVIEGNDVEGIAPIGYTIYFPGAINPGEESMVGSTFANLLVVSHTSQTFEEVTSVQTNQTSQIPEAFALQQNFPNPFNPSTQIQYEIPNDGINQKVKLTIYNLLGEKIRTLVDSNHEPGFYSVIWKGNDNAEREVSSGIYIYRLETGNFVDSRKMILVR